MDKRRPHLSSLIVSGQMTREEALLKLDETLYDPAELEIDINYLCKKLRITRQEFDGFMSAKAHDYSEFPNWDGYYQFVRNVKRGVSKVIGRDIKISY